MAFQQAAATDWYVCQKGGRFQSTSTNVDEACYSSAAKIAQVAAIWGLPIYCSKEPHPTNDLAGIWNFILEDHPFMECDGDDLSTGWLQITCADDEVIDDEVTVNPSCSVNPNTQLEKKDMGGCDQPGHENAGNPINVAAGNKYAKEADYEIAGNLLSFKRHYNSLDSNDINLGRGWRHTFDREINIQGDFAYVSREDGQVRVFSLPPCTYCSEWISAPDNAAKLFKTTNGWEYKTNDDVTEIFSASGKLERIEDNQGRSLVLTYDGSNRLNRVDSNLGYFLDFTYSTAGQLETIQDHTTRIWTYHYSANGSLNQVDRPDGTLRQYLYENASFPYAFTGVIDERGIRYSHFEYDTNGLGAASYHGQQTTVLTERVEGVSIVYNTDGTRTVTNSRGITSIYTTANQLNASLITDITGPGCSNCGGSNTSYLYDPTNNNLLQKTDNGVITEYGAYDDNDNPGFMVDAKGTTEERRVDFTYDDRFLSKITTITEPSVFTGSNKVTTNVYDAFSNKTSETMNGFDLAGNSVTRTTSYQYNGPLNQLSQIDGPRTDVSDITEYRYYPNDVLEGDNRARLKEIEDANGVLMRSSIKYTATGKIESESRPNGLSLDYLYYPGNDRLQSLTESDGSGDTRVTQWTYLPTSEVESITTGVGTTSSTTLTLGYDDARRLERITDGLGNYVDYRLDTEGNRETETTYDANGTPSNFSDDFLKKQITQTFDAYSRLDTSSQANESQNPTFAPDGTLDTQTDGNGVVTDYSYDALKRLTQTIQDQGGSNAQTQDATTVYGYDVADRLTNVTDPVNGNTSYQYDDLGNLIQQTSPDTGTTVFQYDDAGNLTQKTDAKGQAFIYNYDALNRLTQVDALDTQDDLTYTYDICANGTNRLCSVQSATQTVHTTYNAFGEVTRSQGMTSTYVADKLESMTYPSGAKVSYTYDLAGQITQLDLTQNGTTETIVSNIAYAPLGPIEQLTFGNSLLLTQVLDSAYRITDKSIPNVLSLTGTLFDANGNLTNQAETISIDPQTNSVFGYDEVNRLDSAAGAFGTQSLIYDKNGNRALDTLNAQVTPYLYTPNSNRVAQLNTIPVTLDANGNTENQNNQTYTYTSHNRLETATDDGTSTLKASFTYNGLGQRNHKLNNQTNKEKYFFYGQTGELLFETDAHGNILTEYIYLNGMLIAQYQPDADGDGQTNAEEAKLGTNPTNTDTDQDGLTDLTELLQTGTSTTEADTDQDGSTDNEEIIAGTDPLNAASLPIVDPPSTPVAAPGLQTIALVGLSILFLGIGVILVRRGIHTPAVLFIGLGLFLLPNQYKSNSSDYLFIKSAHALPTVTGQLYFVHTDHLGTPQVMTDQSATVVWQATYDPFGKAVVNEDPDGDAKLVGNNVRFPGQYFDSETNSHYNYFRYYDPGTGRYLTSDPIGLDGGKNTYLYAISNPIRYIDPVGLVCTGVPDNPFGFKFAACCRGHDNCYDGCGQSKKECDDNFYECMLKRCDSEPGGFGIARKSVCRNWARNYYWGVRAFGSPFFEGP